MSCPLLWSGGQKRSMQPRLNPGGGVEQRLVPETPSDELNAQRQAAAAVAGGQCQAGCPGERPYRVEASIAGRCEPLWSLANGARGEKYVYLSEDIIEIAAKRLRRLDCLDICSERQRPAGREQSVAQGGAQFLAMHFVLVGVIARRLELEDAAVMVEDICRGQFHVVHGRTGAAQYPCDVLQQGMGILIGMLPGGSAAKADTRRSGAAIHSV